MALAVRPVRTGEGQRLRRLRLCALQTDPEAFGSTYRRDAAHPAQWWEDAAQASDSGDGQRTFVLVDERDCWLGMVVVRPSSSAPDRATVSAMWVAPSARGRGAARMLCDACAGWAAERGRLELRLGVVCDNQAAIGAYRSAGFGIVGHGTWTGHGRTIGELHMTRSLTGVCA